MAQKAVHYTEQDIEQARGVGLLEYLRAREPENLVKLPGGVYCTAQHDSLKISNGKWMWWSQGVGGSSALDYLTKVRGLAFPEAMGVLVGGGSLPSLQPKAARPKKEGPKALRLPRAHGNCRRVEAYLAGRGIDGAIVEACVRRGLIYEGPGHEAVFVGRDPAGKARFAALRGTDSDVKKDAPGSDKRYAFHLEAKGGRETAHVFEGAVDVLSYATLLAEEGFDWQRENLLSLSGVAGSSARLPRALGQFLADHPGVKTLYLHLDNDPPGRAAAAGIRGLLSPQYRVADAPSPIGKDFNDFLMAYRSRQGQIRKPSLLKRLQEGRDRLGEAPPPPARPAQEQGR